MLWWYIILPSQVPYLFVRKFFLSYLPPLKFVIASLMCTLWRTFILWLQHLVTSAGSEVVFLSVNRLSPLESYETSKHANVVMTSVKPIFQSDIKSSSDFGYSSTGRGGRRENPIDASTLTNTFRYSIPYTQDRSKVHARGVDQQWKRTIILTVRESFPGIYSRQPVVASKCSELSPIEVSVYTTRPT